MKLCDSWLYPGRTTLRLQVETLGLLYIAISRGLPTTPSLFPASLPLGGELEGELLIADVNYG